MSYPARAEGLVNMNNIEHIYKKDSFKSLLKKKKKEDMDINSEKENVTLAIDLVSSF